MRVFFAVVVMLVSGTALADKAKLPKPDYTSVDDIKMAGSSAVGKVAKLGMHKINVRNEDGALWLSAGDNKSGTMIYLSFSSEQAAIVKKMPESMLSTTSVLFRVTQYNPDGAVDIKGSLLALNGKDK